MLERGMVLGGLLGAALVCGRPLQAQVQLTGFVGLYAPIDTKGIELLDRDAHRRGDFAYGGRLTVWASKSFGIEALGGFSRARITRTTNAGRLPRSTNVGFGAGKLMLNLTPKRKYSFVIGGGVSGLHIAKTVIDPNQSETKFGGIGGIGLRLPFGENVALRGDIEDFIYHADFGRGAKLTNDLLLSGGLSISFGR
ncbi:MAG: hypothetical protein ABI647_16405 [Gemmatimonadota bacterium]